VALYDYLESSRQDINIQWTCNPEGAREVIRGSSRVKLIEKPQSLLRERSWKRRLRHLDYSPMATVEEMAL
jgi:hypothetical protein